MEWTGYVGNNESLSKNRSDIENHPDNDTDEEAIEHEMTDVHQKMKYPGYNSQYYGPINILSASTKFTIINSSTSGFRFGLHAMQQKWSNHALFKWRCIAAYFQFMLLGNDCEQ